VPYVYTTTKAMSADSRKGRQLPGLRPAGVARLCVKGCGFGDAVGCRWRVRKVACPAGVGFQPAAQDMRVVPRVSFRACRQGGGVSDCR
jgi:hypothetical protein